MNTPPDLLPCPSKEARELLAAEFAADGLLNIANDILADGGNRDDRNALRAIDKALSCHSASTVDVVEALRVQTDVGLYEALKVAVAGLGYINSTCVGGALKRPGDVARNVLDRIIAELGNEQYDALAEAALSSFPSTLNGEGDNG